MHWRLVAVRPVVLSKRQGETERHWEQQVALQAAHARPVLTPATEHALYYRLIRAIAANVDKFAKQGRFVPTELAKLPVILASRRAGSLVVLRLQVASIANAKP